mgnify:CR=1 FL=1
MRFSKIKWLNILLNILVIVILPLGLGILMAMYIEVLIAAIVFGPGIIVFFAEAMASGSDMKNNG